MGLKKGYQMAMSEGSDGKLSVHHAHLHVLEGWQMSEPTSWLIMF